MVITVSHWSLGCTSAVGIGQLELRVQSIKQYNIQIVSGDLLSSQGRIQLLSKVGVHFRHTVTRGVRGASPPEKKFIFGKNIVHFL